ncbi:MAG TPA: hypothetical protein VEK08_14790 [Planctomycetota bacterium]|nr:hypothetical protein [Planctomycetota bacterium]
MRVLTLIAGLLLSSSLCFAGGKEGKEPPAEYPPKLPDNKTVVTEQMPEFLKAPENLLPGVEIAKTAPTVDFLYLPGQDYAGNPWSIWGDGIAVGDKFYCSLSDHHGPSGTARVFEYDARAKTMRIIGDVRKTLQDAGALPPEMKYAPGKIHSRLDLGKDGWLYYSTHRGSPRKANDELGYKGDWILRTDPRSGKSEVVATFPVEKHSIPAGILDPERLIFYGSTAEGPDAPEKGIFFIAYDVANRKLLKKELGGFERACIFSRSTGCLYWDGKKYDPATNEISTSNAPSVRSATVESAAGIVYGTTKNSADIWAYDVKNDKLTQVAPGAVGKQGYTTTIEIDPTGRYLYYTPGAHGGAENDGTPIVQFDLKTKTRKVIAFLHPAIFDKYGYMPIGTFSSALDPKGEVLYVAWNGKRKGVKGWDCCAMTAIHIPASERQP